MKTVIAKLIGGRFYFKCPYCHIELSREQCGKKYCNGKSKYFMVRPSKSKQRRKRDNKKQTPKRRC